MKKKTLLSIFIILILMCTICFATTDPTYYSSSDTIIKQILFMYAYVLVITLIIMFIFLIIRTISLCFIFDMADSSAWKAIIPIYNSIIFYNIIGLSPWLLLLNLLLFIPFVGIPLFLILRFIMSIIISIKLAKAFGKSGTFAIGTFFLPTIFYCILAFGDNRYELGDAKKANELFGDSQTKKEKKSKSNKYIVVDSETGEEIDPEFFKPMDLSDYQPKSDFFK